jgi:hypothetical protein
MTFAGFIGVFLTIWAVWAFARMASRSRMSTTSSSAVTLQNEDRIVCTVALEIQLSDFYLLATIIPFSPDQRESIKAEAEVLKEAAINRWAFQFESAIDARKKPSYDSLTKALESGISSPRFSAKASVTSIQIAYQFKAPHEPETGAEDVIVESDVGDESRRVSRIQHRYPHGEKVLLGKIPKQVDGLDRDPCPLSYLGQRPRGVRAFFGCASRRGGMAGHFRHGLVAPFAHASSFKRQPDRADREQERENADPEIPLKKPRRGLDEKQCGREEMSDDKHDGAVASGSSIHFRADTAVVQ